MCEKDSFKAEYLAKAFPEIKVLFSDMMQLSKGKGHDHLSDQIVNVPKVSQSEFGFMMFYVRSPSSQPALRQSISEF